MTDTNPTNQPDDDDDDERGAPPVPEPNPV